MKINCPKCGSDKVIRIAYGYPTPDLGEEARQGKVKLGGCCVTGHDPTHYCMQCKREFILQQ